MLYAKNSNTHTISIHALLAESDGRNALRLDAVS